MNADRLNEIRSKPYERDYIERTIATVRNHKDADNCWPQWANIFADEIEACWAALDAAEQQARLNEQGYPHGISWREIEGCWYLELHRDGWDIEISFGADGWTEESGVWIAPHDNHDAPLYDSEQAEQRGVEWQESQQEWKALAERLATERDAAEQRAVQAEQRAADAARDADEASRDCLRAQLEDYAQRNVDLAIRLEAAETERDAWRAEAGRVNGIQLTRDEAEWIREALEVHKELTGIAFPYAAPLALLDARLAPAEPAKDTLCPDCGDPRCPGEIDPEP